MLDLPKGFAIVYGMTNNEQQKGPNVAIYMIIGMAIGLAVGVSQDSIALPMAIGLVIGAVVGGVIRWKANKK